MGVERCVAWVTFWVKMRGWAIGWVIPISLGCDNGTTLFALKIRLQPSLRYVEIILSATDKLLLPDLSEQYVPSTCRETCSGHLLASLSFPVMVRT